MRWCDRHGTPLPLDAVFAQLHLNAQKRAGLAVSHVLQKRARRAAVNETQVLLVRDRSGTRRYEGEPPR